MTKTYVTLGNRQYSVTKYADGSVSIFTNWDLIVPSTVYSVHPQYSTRSMSIRADGKIGRKVLKLAAASLKEGSE